jgi:phage baseplate assembly protein gpV
VIDVGDPDGLGRVRVSLPAYDNLETDWLHVIAPAAGRDKGLMMLPNTNDQVLVLFTSREPGQGVVIGGFYAPDLPYDTGVEDSSVQRYTLRTPGGHVLRLDDFGHSLRLEDSHGSYVEMTPDKVRLFANTDLEISAPGRNIVIQSNAIDFRRG